VAASLSPDGSHAAAKTGCAAISRDGIIIIVVATDW
jgi:hypothetical protein